MIEILLDNFHYAFGYGAMQVCLNRSWDEWRLFGHVTIDHQPLTALEQW